MNIFSYQKFAFIFLCAVVMLSCAVSKEGRSVKHSINGSWTLQSVRAENINTKFKAKLFNEADADCFTGSKWNFISNNSMGTYTLNSASGCPGITRSLRWSVYEQAGEERKLQFKRLDNKRNPVDNNDGFRLSIVSMTDATMQLKSSIVFEGQPAAIVYNFVKN